MAPRRIDAPRGAAGVALASVVACGLAPTTVAKPTPPAKSDQPADVNGRLVWAKVEVGVLIAQCWVLAKIRNLLARRPQRADQRDQRTSHARLWSESARAL